MLNTIEKFKRSILHLNRSLHHWYSSPGCRNFWTITYFGTCYWCGTMSWCNRTVLMSLTVQNWMSKFQIKQLTWSALICKLWPRFIGQWGMPIRSIWHKGSDWIRLVFAHPFRWNSCKILICWAKPWLRGPARVKTVSPPDRQNKWKIMLFLTVAYQNHIYSSLEKHHKLRLHIWFW